MLSNVFAPLFLGGLLAGIGWLSGHFLNPHPKVSSFLSALFLALTLVFVGAFSWSYVTETLIWPGSDARACFDIALRFYESEFGAVTPEGSYLSLWPFQTGLIFLLEKCMRLFGNTAPCFFKKSIVCIFC
ncbi:MAG: hypothetical protein J6C84_00115 [Lachnospiraceae bacterium]|nr:hypothetical protein [Lachnospiraceae bacterium]